MTYTLTPRNPALSATESVEARDLRKRIYELSGRDVMGYASVRDALRRKGRVYVQCAKAAPGRERFGHGILVTLDNALAS